MKNILALTALMIATVITHSAQNSTHYLPLITGKDLNGKPWTAPGDFPAEKTLVIVAFEEEQQAVIDTWIEGLELKNPSTKIPWIEMPLINNPGMLMRWFINSGMQRGIPDVATRAHVWTAYTNKSAFLEACGISSTETIYALVVDRQGRILGIESGVYTSVEKNSLLKALLSTNHSS